MTNKDNRKPRSILQVITPLWGIGTLNQNSFSLPAMLLSAVGAITLLAALNFLYRRGEFRFH